MPAPAPLRLGDVVVKLGFAQREVVEAVVSLAREDGQPIGKALVEANVIDASQLARALADRNGMDYLELDKFEVDYVAASLISIEGIRRFGVIPIAFVDDETLLVATSDPSNLLGLDTVRTATDRKILPIVCSPEDIDAIVSELARRTHTGPEFEVEESGALDEKLDGIEVEESADDGPVVAQVHSIISEAVARGASDVHLEPRARDLRVRFRIDGVVSDSTTIPKRMAAGVISRLKIMAELDIAERRAPQDGRIGVTIGGRYVDIRVAILPVLRGEAAVLRVLDRGRLIIKLDELGMSEGDRALMTEAVNRSHGAVLVTGPTGSGKTTTLYATLNEINTPDKTLIAIEDPIEYELEDIKQVQVNVRAGLTFASGLRSMVRSDPDVLMVGEIRDRETAQTAVESALTGHLVLSTLHTGDAPTAPARMIEMGIEPFLIASGVHCVVGQRLVRRLCDECKAATVVSAEELQKSGFASDTSLNACEPTGCLRCGGTGYRGRVGIYEVMVVSDEIRHLILKRASSSDIAAAARRSGMRGMRADGLEKISLGLTSVAEVLRVIDS